MGVMGMCLQDSRRIRQDIQDMQILYISGIFY